MYCDKILISLGLKTSVALQGSDLLAEISLDTPFYEGLGFPPGLIPIANSIGSFSYFGVYVHDIVTMAHSFVDLMVDESEIYEIGKNEAQFCLYLARRAMLDYYEEDDDELTNKLFKLCSLLGVDDPKKIGDLSDEEFLKLNAFNEGIPKYLLENKPGTSYGNTGFETKSNGVELDHDLISVFNEALQLNDLQKAWNALNSPGWSLRQAKLSFKELVDKYKNDYLINLYDEWTELNHPEQGY